MIKKIIGILGILILFIVTLQTSFALDTYVGIKIMNLSDDPAYSCAGLTTGDVDNPLTEDFNETTYDSRGRIRALSSILPNLPIYFNLTKQSDGSVVWDGDITKDCFDDGTGCDYTIGDTILIPESLDLNVGDDYKLFIDVDAIRFYLPLTSYSSFIQTLDDNYWTGGKFVYTNEYFFSSVASTCDLLSATYDSSSRDHLFIAATRNNNLSNHFCFTDTTLKNCASYGFMSIKHISGSSFNIGGAYTNLYQPDVGNFAFIFTMN